MNETLKAAIRGAAQEPKAPKLPKGKTVNAGFSPADDPSIIPPAALSLEGASDDVDELDDDLDDDADNAKAPATRPEKSQDTEAMVKAWVYDNDTDDYVERVVPASSLVITSDERPHDGFAISQEYHKGEGANFDYRWVHHDPEKALLDRQHGFVPVRKLLDNHYRLEGGAVRNGDLVLARRPKRITEDRAKQQADLTAGLQGEVDALQEAGESLNMPVFGDVEMENGGRASVRKTAELHEALEASRAPRGRKSFTVPNMEWQRDKVAERATRQKAAVGG